MNEAQNGFRIEGFGELKLNLFRPAGQNPGQDVLHPAEARDKMQVFRPGGGLNRHVAGRPAVGILNRHIQKAQAEHVVQPPMVLREQPVRQRLRETQGDPGNGLTGKKVDAGNCLGLRFTEQETVLIVKAEDLRRVRRGMPAVVRHPVPVQDYAQPVSASPQIQV